MNRVKKIRQVKKDIRSIRELLNAERPDCRDKKYTNGVNFAERIKEANKGSGFVNDISRVITGFITKSGLAGSLVTLAVKVVTTIAPKWWTEHKKAQFDHDMQVWERSQTMNEQDVMAAKERLTSLEDELDELTRPSVARQVLQNMLASAKRAVGRFFSWLFGPWMPQPGVATA